MRAEVALSSVGKMYTLLKLSNWFLVTSQNFIHVQSVTHVK